jgi:cyclic pyranopterin phosphate synthase
MEGLAAAKAAGLAVKINTVVLRGINEGEIDDLIAWCGERGFDMTLIETMPMGGGDAAQPSRYLPLGDLRERLSAHWTLTDIPDDTEGPARYARIDETGRRIGFITPMSHGFCQACNRVRLTSTGRLYLCLGQDNYVDLRETVRASESNALLTAAIENAVALKPKGHDFVVESATAQLSVVRSMSVTGG